MEKIVHKQITLTIIAGVFVLGIGTTLWWFVHGMQSKADRVLAVKEQVASYEANKKIFSEESKELKALADRVSVFEGYRITATTTPDLLSSLENIAQEHHIDFAITSVQTPDAANTTKLSIDFSAKGPLAALDSFLDALQHQRYQIQITHLSLHRDMTVAPTVATVSKDQKAKPAATPPVEWELIMTMEIVS